jgi:hypothetical protein
VQVPEFQQPEEETAKRSRVVGKILMALLAHWKTNIMLGAAIWYSWKEKFWREPLYRFTFPFLIVLCSLPLLDDLIEYYRKKADIKK